VPYYADLNPANAADFAWDGDPKGWKRTIAKLLELRAGLGEDEGAPPARSFDKLILGTWNLREFDSGKWGDRVEESYAYIAEIVNRFDLVAVQEVRAELTALEKLMRRLGPHWDYLVSDTTQGRAGNQERLAFLYDKRKVRFLGIAGELVLPPVETKSGSVPSKQVARTPLMAAFQVGWTKFILTTVHIVYGDSSAVPPERVKEIEQVAKFLKQRSDDKTEPIHNFVIVGDFNIFAEGDKTMKALLDAGGFSIPKQIKTIPGSNLTGEMKYDQIAFRSREGRFESTEKAGVFDYYAHVFKEDEADVYRPYIDAYIAARHKEGKKSPKAPASAGTALRQYKDWRTFQMSDHKPLWAEFAVDFSDRYLEQLAAAKLPK
jgi:endonuclease/exonuclease/phosphatase family metal-dependent hydrolase